MMKRYIYVVFLISSVAAIFEDQVGKFDWRNQYVGCPRQVYYQRSKPTASDLIYVSSEENVVAAIKPTTGDIAWRQLTEASKKYPFFLLQKRFVISLGRDGEVVRAWEREKGLFAWERQLPDPDRAVSIVGTADGSVVVIGASSVYLLSLSNGNIKWSTDIDKNKIWVGATSTQRHVIAVGGSEGQEVVVVKFDFTNGKLESKQSVLAKWFSLERCSLIGSSFVCFDSEGLHVLDLVSDALVPQQVSLPEILEIFSVKVDGYVGVSTSTNTYLYELGPASPLLTLTFSKAATLSMVVSSDGRKFVASATSKNGGTQMTIDDVAEKRRVFTGEVKDATHTFVKDLTVTIAGREFELVSVGDDCRVDLYVTSYTELINEWSRHEALSTIASVELIDLPLSEAQAGIESEFTADGGNILESLIRRLMSQVDQIRRAVIGAGKEIFSTSSLLNLRTKSISDWISSLRYSTAGKSSKSSEMPLERDYFNLRKIIVATTQKCIVYGLDSSDGSVLWSLYLGKNMAPLKLSLKSSTVPLFIQRTTANFQFAPQAAVMFSNKITSEGVIITFNPVTGAFIERIDLGVHVKRVELLPFAGADSLLPLLVIDDSDKLSIIPPYTPETRPTLPTHLFSFDESGRLEGFKLDPVNSRLATLWKSSLALSSSQKVIAVIGKPTSQRVHSSGRVLGDRSVLYKYSNPNLVAIAVFDSEHSSLHVHLVDAVSGYIVYSGKQNKVLGPFHFVHCENWLTYSYWNEKARRTEIAVIELYEGLKQTDESVFSSLTPVVPPVVNAVSQAYIFPQGISAMGVTDTEQGLSTRSVLIAMPFGGLYGISKRMLDARRPLEMTPELAEEMLIPYRPELPIVSEDFVNYNQTVLNIRGIKAAPSGLESTSLVLAYGLDMFFTRMTPSGTFDILKDDFDHKLITLVLLGLVLGSVVCKKLGRSHTLKQAWQ